MLALILFESGAKHLEVELADSLVKAGSVHRISRE
jgi:hypothetical protein